MHSHPQGWAGPLLQLQAMLCCIAKSENMKVSISVFVVNASGFFIAFP